jgi:hypothetical protein
MAKAIRGNNQEQTKIKMKREKTTSKHLFIINWEGSVKFKDCLWATGFPEWEIIKVWPMVKTLFILK